MVGSIVGFGGAVRGRITDCADASTRLDADALAIIGKHPALCVGKGTD
jgi:hypothetical protein